MLFRVGIVWATGEMADACIDGPVSCLWPVTLTALGRGDSARLELSLASVRPRPIITKYL